MHPSRRTATLTLAAALGLGSIVGLATPALADGPQAQGTVLTLPPHTDPPPAPLDLSAGEQTPDLPPAPTPLPQPEPPAPDGPGDLEQPVPVPEPHPLPGPQHGDDKDGPDVPEPECQPNPNACDKGIDQAEPDDGCGRFQASCDLTDRPADPDDEDDESPDTEVEGTTTDRGALPRTGAGIVTLGVVGGALTGVGAALRRLARR